MMKNIIIAATMVLAPLAMAGVETGLTTAPAPSKFSWEASAVYNVSLSDINENVTSPSIDTYGINLTGLYNVQGNHYATLSFTYAYGSQGGYNLNNFALLPGYRYQRPVSDKLSVFAGASVGLGVSMLDYPNAYGYGSNSHALSSGDDMANVVYSVEVGARYAVTPTLDVVGALMFTGGTSPFDGAEYSEASEEQYSIGVRLGVGGQF